MKLLVLSLVLFLSSAQAGLVDFASLKPRSNYGAIVDGDGNQADLALSYRSLTGALAPSSNRAEFWNTGYSDLEAVAYPDVDGLVMEITLTPVGFNTVTLNSFYLGSYSGGPVRTASILRVTDGSGVTLWSDEPYKFPGGKAQKIMVNKSGSQLKILLGQDWNLGLNLINYSTSNSLGAVPEPSSVMLALSGAAVLLYRLRRR